MTDFPFQCYCRNMFVFLVGRRNTHFRANLERKARRRRSLQKFRNANDKGNGNGDCDDNWGENLHCLDEEPLGGRLLKSQKMRFV